MRTVKWVLMSLGLALPVAAVANDFSVHVNLGYIAPSFSNGYSNVWINQFMENQYSFATSARMSPFFGGGVAYQWNLNPVAINLGASVYYMQLAARGVNSPFINVPGISFDTLNYTAAGRSYEVMLEPKFILARYRWQPYVIVGAGFASNYFSGYAEVPTDPDGSASPGRPFKGKTIGNFAYEAGIGIQHEVIPGKHPLTASLDYRYMNWGNAGLSGFSGEATQSGINFGNPHISHQ